MREETVRDATLKRQSPSVLYEEEAEKGCERRQGAAEDMHESGMCGRSKMSKIH